MDRETLFGRWVLDPDDVAGFEQLGLHGFEFGRHGDAVMSALGSEGLRRALFLWRLDGQQLLLTELASHAVEHFAVATEGDDRLWLNGVVYLRRDADRRLDSESGLFLMGAAGLRHGLASVSFEAPADTEAFVPLLLLEEGGLLSAARLDAPQGADVEALARERVRSGHAERWALVHDGASEGSRAVVVKVGERGTLQGRTLMLRYRFERGAALPVGPVDAQSWEGGW